MDGRSITTGLVHNTNWWCWKMINNASITTGLGCKQAVMRYTITASTKQTVKNELIMFLLLNFCPRHPKWVVMRPCELELKTTLGKEKV